MQDYTNIKAESTDNKMPKLSIWKLLFIMLFMCAFAEFFSKLMGCFSEDFNIDLAISLLLRLLGIVISLILVGRRDRKIDINDNFIGDIARGFKLLSVFLREFNARAKARSNSTEYIAKNIPDEIISIIENKK
jgi:hypothetical protein